MYQLPLAKLLNVSLNPAKLLDVSLIPCQAVGRITYPLPSCWMYHLPLAKLLDAIFAVQFLREADDGGHGVLSVARNPVLMIDIRGVASTGYVDAALHRYLCFFSRHYL